MIGQLLEDKTLPQAQLHNASFLSTPLYLSSAGRNQLVAHNADVCHRWESGGSQITNCQWWLFHISATVSLLPLATTTINTTITTTTTTTTTITKISTNQLKSTYIQRHELLEFQLLVALSVLKCQFIVSLLFIIKQGTNNVPVGNVCVSTPRDVITA